MPIYTIGPRVEQPKKGKPRTMIVSLENLPENASPLIFLYASPSFWDDLEKNRFDLGLLLGFQKHLGQVPVGENFKVTDGKSVIEGRKISLQKGELLGGYMMKSIYSNKWAKERGYYFAPHRKVHTAIDHKGHFIQRYKKRNFNLGLVCAFIERAPMAKLGQRIKIVSEDDILIGTRTHMYGSMLISGMRRGEIDMEDYVDKVMR